MISRSVLAVDRSATLLLALVLLAGGGLAVWWWTGQSPWPATLDASSAATVTAAGWWPAAVAATGVVLALAGLRWLAAHLRRTTVGDLHLSGSGDGGRLLVEAGRVASAAADAFAEAPGVRSAGGRVQRDRGQLVVRISATIDRDAELGRLAQHADLVSGQLAGALQRPELRCSVELEVARLRNPLGR